MEVRAKVEKAFRQFMAKDIYLLQVKANERSITHRFAVYLEEEFPDYNVDCEYNRVGGDTKRLESFRKQVTSDDLKAVSVFPDIIVHHRGTINNLVVIEAKLSSSKDECSSEDSCTCDRCKLHAYRDDLHFSHAFFVVFPVERTLDEFNEALISNCIRPI